MHKERCSILENRLVAPGHYVLRMKSPRIAKAAQPGQFVQVLCSDFYEPLLPRPFSFLTADAASFSLLYHVVGKGTKILSQMNKGETLQVVGPLGNGFDLVGSYELPACPAGRGVESKSKTKQNQMVVLVGGGVGIPPLYHLAQVLVETKRMPAQQIHVFLGAREKSLLLCEKDFKKLGINLHVATDDGSRGHKGFVTFLLKDFLRLLPTPNSQLPTIHACGPTPMLKAVSSIAAQFNVSCEVSVEEPMACGFGACLGCAIEVKDVDCAGGSRFAIACSEGPVFPAEKIKWR